MAYRPLLVACALLLTFASSSAHSFLVKPKPYNRVFKTVSCKGSECSQACPNILNRGMENTAQNPQEVWRRGETVTIKWAKNNHRGGLTGFGIVPVDKMMSMAWHKKLTLYKGCWEQGQFRCSGYECGSDTDNEAFQRRFKVPLIIPDGVYVFQWTWYGGLHFSRDKGQFPDYHSCSYIRIRGGPFRDSYQPFFQDGDTGRFRRRDGTCETASDEVGKCPKSGCTGRSFFAKSKEFQNGRMPPRLTPADYADRGPVSTPSPPQRDDEKSNTSQDRSGGRNGERSGGKKSGGRDGERSGGKKSGGRNGGRSGGKKSGGSGGGSRRGICRGSVCCSTSCGRCGGSGCQRRRGGAKACCYTIIKRSGRKCGRDAPPCAN